MGYSGKTKELQNTKYKNLKTSLILFVIALIVLVIAVGILVFGNLVKWLTVFGIMMPILFSAFFILMGVSALKNASYRKCCLRPGKLSTALCVLQYIFLLPIALMLLILLIISFFFGAVPISGGGKEKVIKIKDKRTGKEYILKVYDESRGEYIDQNGDIWVAIDNGRNFVIKERHSLEPINTTDDRGNEKNMTPISQYSDTYKDENGDYWRSYDGGQNFELTTKWSYEPIYINQNGKEFKLTPISSGSSGYLDENGDGWYSPDGGKTFEKL